MVDDGTTTSTLLAAAIFSDAVRLIVDKDSTTIVGGGTKSAIEGRASESRSQIKASTSDDDHEKLEERLARLTGGVAVIRVGGPSEAGMKNRREAFEDAISATRAAMAERIVPGGELALVRALDSVDAEAAGSTGDERTGVLILKHVLEEPAGQIAQNLGRRCGCRGRSHESWNGRVRLRSRGVYVDLIDPGIIDPTKVVPRGAGECRLDSRRTGAN
jgi:chaperonin GroEL